MFAQPETWVAIAFVILFALFAYLGIHKTVLTALDHRAQRIKAELDDAKRLREEAAKLLGEYQTRRASAEREAQDIIANAKAEAERIAVESKAKMEDFVARRTKTAESKIAAMEARRRCQRRGRSRLDHPVAVGQGLGRRRLARQGHRRSSRQAELSAFNLTKSRRKMIAPAFLFGALYCFFFFGAGRSGFSACGSKPT